jgi:hypothetical protein
MNGYRCLFVLLSMAFGSTCAVAQQEPERDTTYEMARNKVGLLRYCKQKAYLDSKAADDAIEGALQGVKAVSAFRETPISESYGSRAEKNGEAGLWGSYKRPMEQMAQSLVRTPRELCRDWAEESVAALARSATTARR